MIETKIVYADAVQNIPKENMTTMRTNVNQEFEANVLKKMMEASKVTSRSEMEQKLQKSGSSIEKKDNGFSNEAWLKCG